MCDCLEKILIQVKENREEHHRKLWPDASISDVNWSNTYYVMNSPTGIEIAIPVDYNISRNKKDGTPAKLVRKQINMFPTFCPFCGQKRKQK